MSLDLEVIDSFSRAPQAEEWNGVVAASVSNVVFLTREYQQVWYDCFCSSCSLNLHVFRDGGHLIGCAPFYLAKITPEDAAEEQARAVDGQRIRRRYLAAHADGETPAGRTAAGQAEAEEATPPRSAPCVGERVVRLVGGVAVTDYIDMIAPADRLEETWAATLNHWAGRGGEWDVIDLHSLPGWSGSAEIVTRLAQQRGWKVCSDVEETCPVVELPATWDDFLANLNKKDRHELRRKMRRAEEGGGATEYRLLREPDELREGLDQFLKLHRTTNDAKAEFMTGDMEGFFRAVVATTASTGWLEIALLTAGGRAVAAYLSFNYGGRIHLYNSGFDPSYGGVGFVLLVHRMQQAVEQGIKYFDFLRGDERYKYDLGGRDNFIYRVIIRQ